MDKENEVKIEATEFETVLAKAVSEAVAKQAETSNKLILEEIQKNHAEMAKTPANPRPVVTDVIDPLDKDPKGGWKCFSLFAHDVYKHDKSAGRLMTKQLNEWTKYTAKAAGTGLSEGDAEYGGFLVPEEFRNDLMLAVEQKNELWPLVMQVPMAASTIKIPYANGFDESGSTVWGGIQWVWTDEEAAYTEKRPRFGRMTLSLKKLAGLAYMTDELLEDSPISMENILRRGFADGLNFEINRVLIRGTGAGQPLGVLNAPCLVSVAAEAAQPASTIVYENVINMYARCINPGNAVWVANPSCLPQLSVLSVAVGTGGSPVWLPAGGASGSPYNTLMGRPIIWNMQCSDVGTVGDIILGDFSQYVVGMKAGQGLGGKFDTSIHLKFDYGQTAFRFTFRVDGQPWWPTYLTPAVATTKTMSPFVVVATR